MKDINLFDAKELAGGYDWAQFFKRSIYGMIIISALDNIEDVRDGWHDGYNGKTPRHQSS